MYRTPRSVQILRPQGLVNNAATQGSFWPFFVLFYDRDWGGRYGFPLYMRCPPWFCLARQETSCEEGCRRPLRDIIFVLVGFVLLTCMPDFLGVWSENHVTISGGESGGSELVSVVISTYVPVNRDEGEEL